MFVIIAILFIIRYFSIFDKQTAFGKRSLLLTIKPQKVAVNIANKGVNISIFRLNFNDQFFESDYDVLNEIFLMQPEYKDEPIYRKTWRFICDNRHHQVPLTEELWYHSPALFFNSVGFGYCDDSAVIYSHILRMLGYETRVWGLSGHVVSEVLVNNRWEMYDPDLKVYYYNKEGNVAGVEELSNSPNLITNPIMPIVDRGDNTDWYKDAYSKSVADLYSTSEDNEIANWYRCNPLKEYMFYIKLPPGSSFQFPGIYAKPLQTLDSSINTGYANAKLSLPRDWKGQLEIPLVIQTIVGEGNVIIDNQVYKIGTLSMQEKIDQRAEFINVLKFDGNNSNVEIIYLINPHVIKMSNLNLITLRGSNLSTVKTTLVNLSKNNRLH